MMPEQELFELAHSFTAHWEGGFSDDANDRGGATKYGVSLRFLRGFVRENPDMALALGIVPPIGRETITCLDKSGARAIFRHEFWDKPRMHELHPRLAVILYDASVNCGLAQAVKLAQKGVNLTGCQPKLKVDGLLGPITRAALAQTAPGLAGNILDCRQEYYNAIVKKRPNQKCFLKGWTNRVEALRKFAASIPD